MAKFIIATFLTFLISSCSKQDNKCLYNTHRAAAENYAREAELSYMGNLAIISKLRKVSDDSAVIHSYVGLAPFTEDEVKPICTEIIISDSDTIVLYLYNNLNSGEECDYECRFNDSLLSYKTPTGKWILPFINDHAPNDYDGAYALLNIREPSLKDIRYSPYDLSDNEIMELFHSPAQ